MKGLVAFAVLFALLSVFAINLASQVADDITAQFDHINRKIERATKNL